MKTKEKYETICAAVEALAQKHKNGLAIPLAEYERALGMVCGREVAKLINQMSLSRQNPEGWRLAIGGSLKNLPDPSSPPLALPAGCHDLSALLKWCAQNGVVMDMGRKIQACQDLRQWLLPLAGYNPDMPIKVDGQDWDLQSLTVDGVDLTQNDGFDALPNGHPLHGAQSASAKALDLILQVEHEFGNYRRNLTPIGASPKFELSFTAKKLLAKIDKIEGNLIEALGLVREYSIAAESPKRAHSSEAAPEINPSRKV